MLKNLLAVKSVEDLEAESAKGELRRSLGPTALTAIGIGGIIGTVSCVTGMEAKMRARVYCRYHRRHRCVFEACATPMSVDVPVSQRLVLVRYPGRRRVVHRLET